MSSSSRRGLGLILDFKKSPPKRTPSLVHHRHSVSSVQAEPFLVTDSRDLVSWTGWWKGLLSSSRGGEESSSAQRPQPKHNSRFSFLTGDLILMGGFYGSYLKNSLTDARDWLSLDVLLGFKNTNISLPLDLLLEKDALPHMAESMLERIGLIDLCSLFVRELRAWEAESQGSFRFSQFAYDWRQDGQSAAQELIDFVEKKVAANGGKPVTIVARKLFFYLSSNYPY
jgi:hypothetical protein